MSEPIQLPGVTIVAQRAPTNDDLALRIRGRLWGGWTDVRVTRGIERLPSDFEVRLTEFAPAGRETIEILRGDAVEVLIGADVVLTGFVDRIIRTLDARQHTVTISGRSRCQDLVDCAAEWEGGQIVGSSVLEIAQKLAAPYGIAVTSTGEPGPAIPQFNLSRGESAFSIIERLCRFGQLLAYDDPDGDLVLSSVRTKRAASGFREGLNVLRAQFSATIDQRFSETISYLQSVDTLSDLGQGGDTQATVEDRGVSRHRRHIIICETSGNIGWEIAKKRAQWEVLRRIGRSGVIQVTTDAWRDKAGRLYEPNTVALVELPTLRVPSASLTIGEVTYRRGEGGTTCDLTIMPGSAFTPQPFDILQLLPFAELAEVAVKVAPR